MARRCSAWRSLAQSAPAELGIYLIWAGKVLLYIGSSRCVRARLISHNRRKEFIANHADSIVFQPVSEPHLLISAEQELIRRWLPSMNVQMKKQTTATLLTIALDEADNLAIEAIQAHLKVVDSIRRGPIPKREAISWAVRKAAEELRQ